MSGCFYADQMFVTFQAIKLEFYQLDGTHKWENCCKNMENSEGVGVFPAVACEKQLQKWFRKMQMWKYLENYFHWELA